MLTELLPKSLYEPSFQSRNPNLPSKAFCVFVFYRPLLEFSLVVWNLMFKQDINKLESVQRKFSKRLKGHRNFSYEARLTYLGLDSLHCCRRTKADLLMCYNIINNYTCLWPFLFFFFNHCN